jgi:NADH-quinone oxidoreductase subunit K
VITLVDYMVVSATLFVIGIVGVLVRRNALIVFLSVEIMLNAVNINLVAFSHYFGNTHGQVFALFIILIAAAEAAVGLAILVVYFRNRPTLNVDRMNLLKW